MEIKKYFFSPDIQQAGGPVTSTSPNFSELPSCSAPSGFPPGLSKIPLLGGWRVSRRHIKNLLHLLPCYVNNPIPWNKYSVITGAILSEVIMWGFLLCISKSQGMLPLEHFFTVSPFSPPPASWGGAWVDGNWSLLLPQGALTARVVYCPSFSSVCKVQTEARLFHFPHFRLSFIASHEIWWSYACPCTTPE